VYPIADPHCTSKSSIIPTIRSHSASLPFLFCMKPSCSFNFDLTSSTHIGNRLMVTYFSPSNDFYATLNGLSMALMSIKCEKPSLHSSYCSSGVGLDLSSRLRNSCSNIFCTAYLRIIRRSNMRYVDHQQVLLSLTMLISLIARLMRFCALSSFSSKAGE
jgi:hypothetical protein